LPVPSFVVKAMCGISRHRLDGRDVGRHCGSFQMLDISPLLVGDSLLLFAVISRGQDQEAKGDGAETCEYENDRGH
jgi:hypothetical protein